MTFHSDVADHTIHLRHEAFVLLCLLEQHNNYWVFIYDSAATFLFLATCICLCPSCNNHYMCLSQMVKSSFILGQIFQFTNNPDNKIL
jgi:hypothetical protein